MEEFQKKPEVRGIMNRMRQQTHIVLWLLVFSFVGLIVFEWGMDILGIRDPGAQGVLAEVNGHEISYQQYWDNVQGQYIALRDQLGTAPDEQYMHIVREQVFQDMISAILMREAIEEIGLFATDNEIVQEIRYRPRPDFLNSPDFQKEDGTFDVTKYEVTLGQLAQTNAPFLLYLEAEARARIPEVKLHNLINATIRVTDEEVKQAFLEEEQTATVEYIGAEANLFSDVAIDITDQEIADYYRTHENDYFEEETRQLRYVILDTSPTAEDSAAIESSIKEALGRAQAGEDFAELALEYTDSDGDLGTFGKGSMVAEFENAIFSDNVIKDDILGPIETPFGKHIIKIERLVKNRGEIDSVQARHILFEYKASTNTIEGTETNAKYFILTAREEGFDKTAEQYGLTVSITAPFNRSGFIPGFGTMPEIADFAFLSEYDAENQPVSEVIEAPAGFIVFQLSAVNEEHTKTPDDAEVRLEIEQILQTQQQIIMAQNLLARVKSDIDSGASLNEAAEKENLEVRSPEPFKINDYIPYIGTDIKFTSASFGLDPGSISHPVTGDNGVYLIRLIVKDSFDETLFSERKNDIFTRLTQQKANSMFSIWLQNLREKAELEDFRDNYFLQ